jgi:AraC-like DNA-binding protein
LADVVHREQCKEVGFAAYAGFGLDDLGSMAHAIRSTETVNDALGTFSRRAARAFEGNLFWVEEDGDEAWLCNRIVDDVAAEGRAIAQHASVMILAGLLRSVAGAGCCPLGIRLQAERTRVLKRIPGLEDCQATFECSENAVAFPAKFLSRATNGSWRSKTQPSSDAATEESASFVRSLHRLIESHAGHARLPSLQTASEMTGLSVRTLKRRLFDSGVTYRELLDRIRFHQACAMLMDSRMSVKEIALELRYANPSNFIRAFHRIAGTTPTEFRRKGHRE